VAQADALELLAGFEQQDLLFMRAGSALPLPVIESNAPVANIRMAATGTGLTIANTALLRLEQDTGTISKVNVYPAIPPIEIALICRSGTGNFRISLLREALLSGGKK
jgi:DNA-binding transcriptional LysR family regulator